MTRAREPEIGDILYVGREAAPGVRACVAKTPTNEHHPGLVRPVATGQSIIGEALITKQTDTPGVYEVVDKVQGPKAAGSGPAQVATDDYRDGWDRIFGAKPKASLPS